MVTAPLSLRLGRFCYLAVNVAIVTFLLAPIAIVFVFAVNPTPYIQFPPVGISIRWFEKFFASRDFMNALWLSLEVAAMTTVAATLFGASAALASSWLSAMTGAVTSAVGPGWPNMSRRTNSNGSMLRGSDGCIARIQRNTSSSTSTG